MKLEQVIINKKKCNKNVLETIGHNKYKYVLLKNKCLRHSMNKILSKHHRTRTYEINKISLSCFGVKICIQNIGYDGSSLGCQS